MFGGPGFRIRSRCRVRRQQYKRQLSIPFHSYKTILDLLSIECDQGAEEVVFLDHEWSFYDRGIRGHFSRAFIARPLVWLVQCGFRRTKELLVARIIRRVWDKNFPVERFASVSRGTKHRKRQSNAGFQIFIFLLFRFL